MKVLYHSWDIWSIYLKDDIVVGAILPNEAAEALPHVQKPVFSPQVHEAVRGRRAGKSHDPLNLGADLH